MKRLKASWRNLEPCVLGQALRRKLAISWSESGALLDAGKVHVNGVLCLDGRTPLAAGAELSVDTDRRAPGRRVEFSAEGVVSATQDFVVVDKPPALASVPPTKTGEKTLKEFLDELFLPGVFAVHRLDAGTSGLMIFARQQEAARLLTRMMKQHSVERRYLALVHGQPKRGLVLDSPLGRGKDGALPPLEPANTTIEQVTKLGRFSLLLLRPGTGRWHQLRLHLAGAGFPILGDWEHGNRALDRQLRPPRLALHSCSLELDWRGQRLSYSLPLAPDLQGFIEASSRNVPG